MYRSKIPAILTLGIASVALGAPELPKQVPTAAIEAKFKEFDKNGDGELRGDELNAAPFLRLLDANGDGGVTLEEAQNTIAAFTARRAGGGGERGFAAVPAAPVAPSAKVEDSPRQGPAILKPAEMGVGVRLRELSATMLDGQERPLWNSAGAKGLIVAMVSPDCPVGKRYLPTLAEIQKSAGADGFGLLVVGVPGTEKDALKAALEAAGITAPAAIDAKGTLAKALGATVSTDVFLYDASRTLRYRGAIDDQYGIGYQRETAREKYLVSALSSVKAGERVAIAATEAPGCVLDLSDAPAAVVTKADVTYHNRISRIVQQNCLECHSAGGLAPFALETYEQVSAKAGMIRKMVSKGLMPPWFASPTENPAHSPWKNDRSLAASDKADLLTWLDAGKPAGDEKDAPQAIHIPRDWQIGKPDLVAQIPTPIEVKATGTMRYQYSSVELNLTEDKWVRGIEVQPTAREVVHHVLVFAQEKGKPLRQNGEAGGFFAAYVPGSSSVIYPDGFAKPLPAGSKLIFQIHYTPNGTATKDQVKIGLLFANEPPQHEVRVIGISSHKLNIPPGADNVDTSATIPVPRPVRVMGLMPHMHVRGKAFRYDVELPDGTSKPLLEVPRYDFNWQLAYRFNEPLALPPGSRVKATGWYDNSTNNPANPDPTATVKWGEQTTDEMMIGYVEYYFTDEDARTAR